MDTQLQPFSIGNVEVKFRVVLAALAGYSDLPYRTICRRLGAPFCATEMMLDRSVLQGGKLTNRLVASDSGDHPVAGQLIGNDPETMSAAAIELDKRGFDVIDLNFACPVHKAIRRKRGGFMMKAPEDVIKVTQAVVNAVNRPVTLKLRKSFFDEDVECEDFWRMAEGAFDAGAAGICVHGRTVQAKYAGSADWQFIAEVKRRFADKLVMGSGDAFNPSCALEMLRETGVDAATAARGSLGNPWFFRQFQDIVAGREPYDPSLSEQREVIAEHFTLSSEFYGVERGCMHMRKFGIKYARMHPSPKKLRMAFVAVKNTQDWKNVLETYYRD